MSPPSERSERMSPPSERSERWGEYRRSRGGGPAAGRNGGSTGGAGEGGRPQAGMGGVPAEPGRGAGSCHTEPPESRYGETGTHRIGSLEGSPIAS